MATGSTYWAIQEMRPGRVAILDTATKSLSDAVPITIAPNTVAITPDGQKLLIGGSSTDLVIVDTQTDVVSGAVSPFPNVLAVAFSPDGARTYALASAALGIINTATNRLLLTIDLSAGFGHLAVAPDGKILAATRSQGGISVVDTIANTLLTTLPFRAGDIVIAGFPCGQVPATATPTETIPPSPKPIPTASPTRQASPATPTATPIGAPPMCVGDCNNDGRVTAGEVTKIIAVILQCGGTASGCPGVPGGCANADKNRNGIISAGELTNIISDVLQFPLGCPITTAAAAGMEGVVIQGQRSGGAAGGANPQVAIGNASGAPAGQVTLMISLTKNGTNIVTVLPLILDFDPNVLALVSCSRAAAVSTGKSISTFLRTAGEVAIQLSGDLETIPDGDIIDCTFTISGSASSGVSPVRFVSANLSDDQFNDFFAMGSDGSVTVNPAQQPPTATQTMVQPTPTPTPPLKPCIGDCNGDGEVPVNELITMVNIALGTANVSSCTAGDADGSGDITINEIVSAVNNALNGCG